MMFPSCAMFSRSVSQCVTSVIHCLSVMYTDALGLDWDPYSMTLQHDSNAALYAACCHVIFIANARPPRQR